MAAAAPPSPQIFCVVGPFRSYVVVSVLTRVLLFSLLPLVGLFGTYRLWGDVSWRLSLRSVPFRSVPIRSAQTLKMKLSQTVKTIKSVGRIPQTVGITTPPRKRTILFYLSPAGKDNRAPNAHFTSHEFFLHFGIFSCCFVPPFLLYLLWQSACFFKSGFRPHSASARVDESCSTSEPRTYREKKNARRARNRQHFDLANSRWC